MARGDMKVNTLSVNAEVLVLNRKEFQAVPMTVDFSAVTDTVNGVKVVKAGTPVNKNGAAVKTSPWTGAIGILLHDVYEDAPQGACIKEGYIHVTRAQANSGLTYNANLTTALNAAGCRIVLEEPII